MAKLHFRPSWLCVIAALLCMCAAINPGGFPNGVLTAPRGWRSWNAVAEDVTQSFILRQVDALVARRHSVDGKPTSLCDLGYCDVGLDDNWQKCGSYGADELKYHEEDGSPVVNTELFPSFKNMTGHAHSLGLTSGWYGNNCICSDSKIGDKKFYEGDVKALRDYGFDSLSNAATQTRF